MKEQTPKHVGIILDGNRRWAQQQGKKPIEGHQAGYKTLKRIIEHIHEKDVEVLSVYAFSTENWKRSEEEVKGLMKLVRYAIVNELEAIAKEGYRVRVVGSLENLSSDIIEGVQKVEEDTRSNSKGTLVFCFNYGGQQEIADAATKAMQSGKKKLEPADIEANLYAPDIPPLDLIIRTGGEQRISNFMLWRAAYSELYFTDIYWPDFSPDDLDEAFKDYASRQRRHGK